jgi:beta-N-acetylhexosaminidase
VLAVRAGVDLLCLGRDTDEEMYHAVRTALADAVESGQLTADRLAEAAGRVATLRAWLASARKHVGSGAPDAAAGAAIGLIAARRALRRSGPVPGPLVDPLVIEVEPEENIAAGRFTWGFARWAEARRVDPAAGDGAAAGPVIAAAGGRSLILAVRHGLGALPLVSEVLAARPDAIVVDMGAPAWTPPPGTAYLATYGASRACAEAAAEALGLA